MSTQTTQEAIALLKATRAAFIERSREVALELIRDKGKTHVREVHEVMVSRGMIDPAVKNHWLGATFRSSQFEWTGEWVLPPVPENRVTVTGNCHDWRPVKVWRAR